MRAAAAVALLFLACVSADDISTRIAAQTVTRIAQAPCVRLLRIDGDEGCAPSNDGPVRGALFSVLAASDVAAFASLAPFAGQGYVALLAPGLLSPEILGNLSSIAHFVGAAVLPSPVPGAFSAAASSFGGHAWNPAGRGLLGRAWRFPIVSVRASDAPALLSHAASNAAGGYTTYPLWSLSLTLYMGPGGLDAGSCLSQLSCLPLGGQSVWGLWGGINTTGVYSAEPASSSRQAGAAAASVGGQVTNAVLAADTRPLVLAAVPLDALSLFHDQTPGAATAGSLVALLAAAEALSRLPSSSTSPSALSDSLPARIGFAAFQAEAWGRLGSRRWAAEVASFTCAQPVPASRSASGRPFCASPLRTDAAFTTLSPLLDGGAPSPRLRVVALDQVGFGAALYAHSDGSPAGGWSAGVAQAAAGAVGGAPSAIVAPGASPPTLALPPSAADAFLELGAAASGGPRAPALLLSPYDTAYPDAFFASHFDNGSTAGAGVALDPAAVAAAAQTLAATLFALAAGWDSPSPAAAAALVPPTLAVNGSYVAALLQCILVDAQCSEFARALGLPSPSALPHGPLSLYTSVYIPPALLGGAGGTQGWSLSPSVLEAVVRNSLAAFASGADVSRAGTPGGPPACATARDCVGSSGSDCLLGACVNPAAWFHDAYSQAIAAPGDPAAAGGGGGFVVTNTSVLSPNLPAPVGDALYAEPYWAAGIGAWAMRVDHPGLGWGLLAAGLLASAAAFAAQRAFIRFLDGRFKVP